MSKWAIHCFVNSLKPGAPSAAAFMENFREYYIGDIRLPAVAIGTSDINECMGSLASKLEVDRIDICDPPLRDGYSGMIHRQGSAHAGVASCAAQLRGSSRGDRCGNRSSIRCCQHGNG